MILSPEAILPLFPLWAFTFFCMNKTRPLAAEDLKNMRFLQKIRYFPGDAPEWALVFLAGIYLYALYCLFQFMTGGIMRHGLNEMQVHPHHDFIFSDKETPAPSTFFSPHAPHSPKLQYFCPPFLH